MGETRLIDANQIVEVAKHAYNEWNLAMATQDTNRGVNKVLKMQELCKCVESVANDAPTIDPETLPIVKELREELSKVKEKQDSDVDVDKAILWLQQYTFDDTKKIYTNGSKLIPYFRVVQALKDMAYNGFLEG